MPGFSNWREEFNLSEVVTGKMTDTEALKKVSEKKGISNKVTINPKLDEAVKEIGGEVISMVEADTTAQKQRIDMKQMILDRQKLKIRRKDFAQKKREGEDVDSTNASKQSDIIAQEETIKQVNEKKRKNALQIQKIVGEGYEAKKTSEVLAAFKRDPKVRKRFEKAAKKEDGPGSVKNRAADSMLQTAKDTAKRKGDTSKSDDRYAYESVALAANNRIADKEKRAKLKKELMRLVKHASDKRADINERLGGKGYKPYTSLTGKKISGDWEDSDRGAGNKAKKRAGGKVEKKSPTYRAYVLNKEEVIAEKDLNAAERRALPDKDFALPGKGKGPEGKQAGSYPIPDEKHARSALSLVAQHGTPEEKATVRAKVKKKFPNIDVNEGLGASMAVTAGLNAVGNIAKAYGASQAAKGAIVGGALSGAGALGGGVLNYMASRNNNKKKDDVKPKKTEQKKKEVKEGVMKFVKSIGRKKSEKKAVKAMDAGARAKRMLARKVHAKYVSGSTENVPDDIAEAKVDQGRSDYGKASIRNYRRKGPGHGEPAMFDPENKRGKLIDKRREEHKARRGVKGAKVPAYKVSEDKAFDFVKNKLKAKYGDGVLTKGDKMPEPSAAQKKRNAEIRAKRAKEDHRDPTEKASDGRYSDRHSNRGSD